jgi:hypothetical protein
MLFQANKKHHEKQPQYSSDLVLFQMPKSIYNNVNSEEEYLTAAK